MSLVELTIDFLLSIINAVLTTKQQRNTDALARAHVHGPTFCSMQDVRCVWQQSPSGKSTRQIFTCQGTKHTLTNSQAMKHALLLLSMQDE